MESLLIVLLLFVCAWAAAITGYVVGIRIRVVDVNGTEMTPKKPLRKIWAEKCGLMTVRDKHAPVAYSDSEKWQKEQEKKSK